MPSFRELLKQAKTEIREVDTAEAESRLADATFLDVREQDEWDRGHIDGIAFIPLGQLPRRWRELETDKRLICVCRSGSRSNYAAAIGKRLDERLAKETDA